MPGLVLALTFHAHAENPYPRTPAAQSFTGDRHVEIDPSKGARSAAVNQVTRARDIRFSRNVRPDTLD